MLSAGASERHHQVVEAALLVAINAGFHHFDCARQKFAHARLLFQVLNHWGIFTGEWFKAFFTAGVRQGTRIKDKAATVSGFILWRAALMKGKTEDPQDQLVRDCI